MWQLKNLKCCTTQKPIMWQNSKTQKVATQNVTKLKNSKHDKNHNVTKTEMWQISKTQIVTKLKNTFKVTIHNVTNN